MRVYPIGRIRPLLIREVHMLKSLAPVAAVFVLAGCYHATIETGLTPSTVTVEKRWAASWIGGLVPPSTVGTQAKCTGGIAKVETQLGFANMLVGFITLGIFTPMDIRVTCAQGGRSSLEPGSPEIRVGEHATPEAVDQALARAVEQSLRTGAPVYVVY